MTRLDSTDPSNGLARSGSDPGGRTLAQLSNIPADKNYDQAPQAVQGRAPDGKIVKGTSLQRTYGTGYVSYFFKGTGASHALPTTLTSRAEALAFVRTQIGKGTWSDLVAGDPRAFDKTSAAAAPSKAVSIQPISGGSVARALLGLDPNDDGRTARDAIATANQVFANSPLAQRNGSVSSLGTGGRGDPAIVLRNTYQDGWDFLQVVQNTAGYLSLSGAQPDRVAKLLTSHGIDARSTEFMRGFAAATADAKSKEPSGILAFMNTISTVLGLIGGVRRGNLRANGNAVPTARSTVSTPTRRSVGTPPAVQPRVNKSPVTVPRNQTVNAQQPGNGSIGNTASPTKVPTTLPSPLQPRPVPAPGTVTRPAPNDSTRAIVVRHAAAVAYDIPAPPNGKGEARVTSVYGTGGQRKGVSEPLATLIARTLQDINPATYGKKSTAAVVRDAVRLDEKTSLIVVVRSKGIAGQSPQADSVATAETWATPAEQVALMKARGADFTQAVAKIRLGTAKIFEQPPANAAEHAQVMKTRAGAGYGYIGQVMIGDNLKGSGDQAMEGAMKLAQAANMKGVTLYTNAASGFYEKLGFKVQGRTFGQDGSVSTHMVWDNPRYTPGQPTLKLNNPAVSNTLKGGGPPLTASPAARQDLLPKPSTVIKPGSTQATVGTAKPTGAKPFSELKATALPFSKQGLETRLELARGSVQSGVQSFYNRGAAAYNAKIEGPVLRWAGNTAQGVNNRVLMPSARVLNDKLLTPVLSTAPGQKLLALAQSGTATIKTAAFEARLATAVAADSTAGRILRDMEQIAKSAATNSATKTFNALGTAGKGLQKAMPGVAVSTAVILTNAAANGTLRMATVAPGVTPTGEALAVKKALNIPNGLGFTYMVADAPGMEKVGGRAISAFGGGASAVITPATGAGQSGVSQPWIGKRADGSIVTTATGAAYGPNAFVGYNLGTPNLNISDVYSGQLGRVSTNPMSGSAGGTRDSGRSADLNLGVVAADLASWSNARVLNAGPAAFTFTRFRDPLSLKGRVASSENKWLVLQPKTNPQGQLYYVPFADPTIKGKASQIEPVVPITGSTTWDPKAKDVLELGSLLQRVNDALPKSVPGDSTPTPQPVNNPALAPKRRGDLTGPAPRVQPGTQPRPGQ